jgi:hypothetical protein
MLQSFVIGWRMVDIWTPKRGKSYNLNTIFDIAQQLLNELQISQ